MKLLRKSDQYGDYLPLKRFIKNTVKSGCYAADFAVLRLLYKIHINIFRYKR